MDIAALASIGKYAELRQSVGIAVAKLAMGETENNTQDLIKLMESSINPNLGSNIDLRV